ncbi:MAG: hypothetical protein NTW04_04235 [Elusimicrobia bacterium]|nr:hypothetical protein [Elusimicrobiota bacterium]
MLKISLKLALVIIVFLCACSKPQKGEFFPIGMYGITKSSQLEYLYKAGFNSFQSYIKDPDTLREIARESKRLGMLGLFCPDRLMEEQFTKEIAKWPVLAWYLYDEPDVSGVSPEQVAEKAKLIKNFSPDKRTAVVVGEGAAALKYLPSVDILMVDWYPVPHIPLESVGQQVAIAVNSHKSSSDAELAKKPVWAVIQAFDWTNYPQGKRKKIGRFPTAYEIRFMTYMAVLRGAKGIFYFTYNNAKTGQTLKDSPRLWQRLALAVTELVAMKSIFEKGSRIDLPFEVDANLAAGAWKYWSRRYVIILNPSQNPAPAPKEILSNPKWRILFEEKRYTADVLPDGIIPPYRVLVFEKN